MSDELAVDAVGVTKTFGSVRAVDDVTLSVAPGEVYGVLGPNGAGKTTFLRMLFGLIRPDSGSLRVFDRTFAVTYGLLAAAIAIGLVGLSSSFGALVLARQREFGMLRHLGVTRRQVAAMLASEGFLVSGIGLAVGLVLGFAMSLVLIHVVNRQSFHWGMEIHVPWGSLAALCAALLALAVLTTVVSARQAMSRDVIRAVKDDW